MLLNSESPCLSAVVTVSHAHVDHRHWCDFIITRRYGLTGGWHPPFHFTKYAFIVYIQHWGIGIRSRRSTVRSPTTFICCPAVYDSSEKQDDFGYRPLKSYHKRLAELALQSADIEAAAASLQACNSSDPSLLRRGCSQSIPTPWRPSIIFLIRQSPKGLYT